MPIGRPYRLHRRLRCRLAAELAAGRAEVQRAPAAELAAERAEVRCAPVAELAPGRAEVRREVPEQSAELAVGPGGAPTPARAAGTRGGPRRFPRRFDSLPRRSIAGREVPVAVGFRARLLGLALLDRAQAGSGLLIPHCAAVHTFGMRFPLDLCFLGPGDEILAVHRGVPPRRFVAHRGATAVLELPT